MRTIAEASTPTPEEVRGGALPPDLETVILAATYWWADARRRFDRPAMSHVDGTLFDAVDALVSRRQQVLATVEAAAVTLVPADHLAEVKRILAAARPHCPGSGRFVLADQVDGADVVHCPECKRHTIAHPVAVLDGQWYAIGGHRPRALR